jgi:serine/threonine-protein kinase
MGRYEDTIVLNYRLVRKLGEGGFGTVFLAEHTELGRRVAVKILHREFASQPEVVERFFREARAVCAIGHPSIIDIENFGRLADGEPFYLMEFFTGESLMDRVHRRPLRADEAITVFDPVAGALTAAHALQIIHRDLKPDNIMVREVDGAIVDVKLLDFGIAKLMHEADAVRSRSNIAMGTPAYMPPEQARDAKGVDARSDVYAFAATLFAALSGRAPFDADSVAGVLLKVQTDPPPALLPLAPHTSAEVQAILERCLAKDPAQRPPSIAAAWGALRAALAACGRPSAAMMATIGPIAASTTTLGAAAGQPSPRPVRRGWRAPLALGVAIATVTTVVLVASRGHAPAPPVIEAHAASPPPPAIVAPPSPPDAAPVPVDAAPIAAPDAAPTTVGPADAVAITSHRQPPLPHAAGNPPKPAADVAAKLPPAGPDCALAGFARVFDAADPSEAQVNGALARLRQCQAVLSADQVNQVQRRLVARLTK